MQLVRYDAARRALAEAHRVDEVKEIHDRAAAAEAYARQARDTAMIQWATEIKVRAERRAGEMLREMAERGERAPHGANRHTLKKSPGETSRAPTLAEMGISKMQAHRWQALASMPDEHFETAVDTAKHVSGEVSAAFVLRQHKEGTEDVIPTVRRRAPGPRTKVGRERLAALNAVGHTTYTAAALRACIKAVRDNPEDAAAEGDLVEELRTLLSEVQANAGLSHAA